MNTNAHPLADVAFLNRAIPAGIAFREGNFAPRAKSNVSVVRKSRIIFEKAEGRNADWVKVS